MKRASTLLLLMYAACTPGIASLRGEGLDDAAYCALLAGDVRARFDNGYATVCDAGDDRPRDEVVAGCRVFRLGPGGASALEIEGALAVLGVDGGMVVHHLDGRLVLRRGDTETQLAAWADAPSVSADGRTLAYLATAAPVDGALVDAGMMLDLVLHPIDGAPAVLHSDPDLADPFALPDGSGAIFTSTRTGVASIFRVDLGGTVTQLTNLDAERVGQGFVPVPSAGELAWAPGTLRAIYTARYDDEQIWSLDVATGEVEEIGPGRAPVASAGGVRIAVLGDGAPECAREIPLGGAP